MPADSKRTPENREIVLKALSTGASYGMAAECASMCENSLLAWRKEDADFAASCARARAEKGLMVLEKLMASPDTNNGRWWLARIWPEDWSEESVIRAMFDKLLAEDPERIKRALGLSSQASVA